MSVNGHSEKDKPDTSEHESLNALMVFDALDVGPVRLEKKRLIAPYCLSYEGKVDQIDLIYTYEENVFDPAEPESQNLADMIASQIALNYGLFCKVIRFNGLFDDTDRRFLRDMAENTAREIYVKKFLEPNPYLQGVAAKLPYLKLKKYLRARIEFPKSRPGYRSSEWKNWGSSPERHCILSSGGKESLLSFGLVEELGKEAHPIFVNESGRHWFTALNAYRHFRDNIPNTARVWVNSDRVFSWMLRHMPFIRKDFTEIRADEYPVRLWTVSVFIFGVLPLIRKRGIGRLLIGDEFDTSRRKIHEGISHYDGLYDQSIWFDNALSRYFLKKGWQIFQFSILRPLSELLIETILTKRYAHLQEHQTSCHAAHKDSDRIRPCGKCEKCRRIVGMLEAIGEDPGRCGYSETQIKECLSSLVKDGAYTQEKAEGAQLFFMLGERGKINLPAERQVLPHIEIMNVRFDDRVAPVSGIPLDLREGLYRVYLTYAMGVMKRIGAQWREMDLFNDPEMHVPYVYEAGSGLSEEKFPKEDLPPQTHFWGELCWPDAVIRFKKVDTVLLPVGAIEQHGPHLPLDTDTFDAEYLAKQVAGACSHPKPLVLPVVPYGVSYHHEDFKGTVSVENDTLSRMIYDIGMSVARNGFKKLVIINGHGGNAPALHFAAQRINQDARIFVCVDTGETSDVGMEQIVETPNDVHAGEIETSTSLAIRPNLVRMDRFQAEIPEFSSRYLNFTSRRGVTWYAYTQKISSSGVMGDPTKASEEKGKKIWDVMIRHLVTFVEQLKTMTLEEIYQKKY
ncbi:MAG: creatininase family protein [Proteobacteria bacterium]|nr:creatininase family protein [Pseudomonadota bacterium]